MGASASTPRSDAPPGEQRDQLLAALVGSRRYELHSDFWSKLLGVHPGFQWPQHSVKQGCQALALNNPSTSHLAKLLVHLVWSLQELASSPASKIAAVKVINATYFSRVFLKYMIENSKADDITIHVSLEISKQESQITKLSEGPLDVPSLAVYGLMSFIGSSDINPFTYMLHLELVNLLLVMTSTQLHSGPASGIHPFLDAAVVQGPALVAPLVRKLLLSFIARTPLPSEAAYYASLLQEDQAGVIRKVSSAAATVFMLPYYTYTYLLSPGENRFTKYLLADNSVLLLLVLMHHGNSVQVPGKEVKEELGTVVETLNLHLNPYRRALECTRDMDFEIVDIEQNSQGARIPFAALYDRLGSCLTEDASILLLYCLVHGNPAFLEYVLVRTDLDTLVMPMLEILYNVHKQSSNQIYMLLVIFLILSQDSTFNASIHKLILPVVPWYKDRLLPGISLGSLMVVVLIRTVKFNLSKLKDVFLHTNCLAILANMAPHMHQLNAYASQRLVNLFDMLARRYNKLLETNSSAKVTIAKMGQVEDGFENTEDAPSELHLYTDFLRIVLEIINTILTYTLPRNPEMVYALLHRQELFTPFKDHPRFCELLENIYTVLDFFNARMDAQQAGGDWSVERVLQIIIANARSWRGEGMKIFTQLRFSYEEELHPEEFFLPYVWQLVVSHSNIDWDGSSISLFHNENAGVLGDGLIDKPEAQQATKPEAQPLAVAAV